MQVVKDVLVGNFAKFLDLHFYCESAKPTVVTADQGIEVPGEHVRILAIPEFSLFRLNAPNQRLRLNGCGW